jgi:hypothetical protein
MAAVSLETTELETLVTAALRNPTVGMALLNELRVKSMSDETTCRGCSGEGCTEHAESRREVKATPVEIVATFADHEAKLTVPLWMFHSFSKMAREHAAQTPGVLYQPNHRDYRFVPVPEPDAVEAMAYKAAQGHAGPA